MSYHMKLFPRPGWRNQPRVVQLPFMRRQMMGLGDVVAGMTRAVGIQPCGGCERRRQWLNQRLQFVRRR
jgi:hypothetical protein